MMARLVLRFEEGTEGKRRFLNQRKRRESRVPFKMSAPYFSPKKALRIIREPQRQLSRPYGQFSGGYRTTQCEAGDFGKGTQRGKEISGFRFGAASERIFGGCS